MLARGTRFIVGIALVTFGSVLMLAIGGPLSLSITILIAGIALIVTAAPSAGR